MNAVHATLGTAIASLLTSLAAWLKAEISDRRSRHNKREIAKLQNGGSGYQKGTDDNGTIQ